MPSPESSRANGRKSRGPVTEQGKRNSSRNSRRHGVYAKSIVFSRAGSALCAEEFTQLRNELRPTTPFELRLVETLATLQARQRELMDIEKSLIEGEIRRAKPPQSSVAAQSEQEAESLASSAPSSAASSSIAS